MFFPTFPPPPKKWFIAIIFWIHVDTSTPTPPKIGVLHGTWVLGWITRVFVLNKGAYWTQLNSSNRKNEGTGHYLAWKPAVWQFCQEAAPKYWWPLSTQMIPVQRVETCTGWYRGIISLFSKVIKKSQRESEHTSIRVINPSKASCDFPYVSKIQFSIFCVWQTPDFWRCRFYILVLLNWYNRRRQNQ